MREPGMYEPEMRESEVLKSGMLESGMLDSVATRELLHLECMGEQKSVRLEGTYHHALNATNSDSTSQGGPGDKPARIGVLYVNSLSLPRAASGDSAVYWADSIAALGYPAFRFDLPGLGDSEGISDTGLLDFINAGGFTNVMRAVMKQLSARYDLKGVVLFGHCAGSVSALYAAAGNAECAGLILLDPYFHLPQAKRSGMREALSEWARSSRVGRAMSYVYDQIRSAKLKAQGSAPPSNANGQLLARWKQVAAAGMPGLLLKAPGIKAQGAKPRTGEFDYIDHVIKLAGKKARVAVEFIQDADHSFANRKGRAAVEQHIDGWLGVNFSLTHLSRRTVELGGTDSRLHIRTELDKQPAAKADQYCAVESR